jgi:hypothetical protein
MNASIYAAKKSTGYKFELTLHSLPSISEGKITVSYHHSKSEAKAAAKAAGAVAYNY